MSSGLELAVCGACGGQTPAGKRFCIHCGTEVAVRCPACGESVVPGARFCAECGTALQTTAPAPVAASGAPPVSERRLVSILFADLVGFTTLSEHRDPEEVRDLLSRYFDRCRSLIERYGGTVEKFIGDAVMAVWGSPIAREDDAERAVRAALSLTGAVSLLGEEVGMAELRVRAGVLTGSAAVDIGLESEGMVLGDAVNTAARLQSMAAPGTVLVDDVTRRASEAAIAYEDAGEHAVKGREAPVRAWTALRVVAGTGGARRSAGLEAPFVGRERELEQVVEAFEESAERGRARRVTVIGEAGAGKSRLLWEYFKYMDGVERLVNWHQGRCLSYGDGVAFWALAEMVRSRAGIAEEEGPDAARVKLGQAVERWVTDERERRLVEPRLAHLLGLEQRTAPDRADLFSGWRLFFERMSEQAPVVLVFEDLQWADSGLLEFIDYLLDWSAERPLFVLALGRPELLDARPAWAAGATILRPLPDAAMRTLLDGLVPGLPEELAGRILARAEGVPLYAVETVRMLLDRGLLAQEGNRYRVTASIDELAVPETLQALAAARLDTLTPNERAVLQDAAVFGQSFTAQGVAALSDRNPDVVTGLLDSLVTKQVLGYNDDRLSSERGQYHFLGALLRTTAYGTLSRRDRKSRHLAAARHLQEAWGGDSPELAEVLAAHFLDAAAADPGAADVVRIRASACETLAEAGERALSLALGAEARRAFDRAAELAGDDANRARLLDQAGRAAMLNADFEGATTRLEQVVNLYEELGDAVGAAHALIAIGNLLFQQDRITEAVELERRALGTLRDAGAERAAALAALARHLLYVGETEEAQVTADAALTIAETTQDWPTIVSAFSTIASLRQTQRRFEEAAAFQERALQLALAHDLAAEALRAYNNVANLSLQVDDFRRAREKVLPGMALAKARGDRLGEVTLQLMVVATSVALGDWDAAVEVLDAMRGSSVLFDLAGLPPLARLHAARGEEESLRRTLERASSVGERHLNVEFSAVADVARAIALNAFGRHAEALEIALSVSLTEAEIAYEDRREAYAEAGRAALALDDEATVQTLIDYAAGLPRAPRRPVLQATAAQLEAALARRRGDHVLADEKLTAAVRGLREVEATFELGGALLEHGELLRADGRDDEAAALLAEAAEIFHRLRAAPWLARTQAAGAPVPA